MRALTDEDRAAFAAKFAKKGFEFAPRHTGEELSGIEVFPTEGGRRFVIGFKEGEETQELLGRALDEAVSGTEIRESRRYSKAQMKEMYDELTRLHREWAAMSQGRTFAEVLADAEKR